MLSAATPTFIGRTPLTAVPGVFIVLVAIPDVTFDCFTLGLSIATLPVVVVFGMDATRTLPPHLLLVMLPISVIHPSRIGCSALCLRTVTVASAAMVFKAALSTIAVSPLAFPSAPCAGALRLILATMEIATTALLATMSPVLVPSATPRAAWNLFAQTPVDAPPCILVLTIVDATCTPPKLANLFPIAILLFPVVLDHPIGVWHLVGAPALVLVAPGPVAVAPISESSQATRAALTIVAKAYVVQSMLIALLLAAT